MSNADISMTSAGRLPYANRVGSLRWLHVATGGWLQLRDAATQRRPRPRGIPPAPAMWRAGG
jgi:hypothetical protein